MSNDRTAYTLTISADELAHTAALIAELRKELPEESGPKVLTRARALGLQDGEARRAEG